MTLFTDNDFKRLREDVEINGDRSIAGGSLVGLLNRLEAAEKLIELRGTHIPNALITREIETAVWAWREAAGKGESNG